jgi:soluble lytic murein transglycosylase-like protein
MRTIILALIFLFSSVAMANDFTEKYYTTIQAIIWAADAVEVPRELLLAICWNESSFRTGSGITHKDGLTLSYGLCQIKLGTAKFMDTIYRHKIKATPKRLRDPRINAFYSAKYLKYQLHRYHNDWKLAVDAYNKHRAQGRNTKYVKRFKKSLALIKNKLPQVCAHRGDNAS